MHLFAFVAFGLVVGFVARFLVPGDQKMSLLATVVLGIVGSLLGGLTSTLLVGARWDEPVAAGWVGSICTSMMLLIAFETWGRQTPTP